MVESLHPPLSLSACLFVSLSLPLSLFLSLCLFVCHCLTLSFSARARAHARVCVCVCVSLSVSFTSPFSVCLSLSLPSLSPSPPSLSPSLSLSFRSPFRYMQMFVYNLTFSFYPGRPPRSETEKYCVVVYNYSMGQCGFAQLPFDNTHTHTHTQTQNMNFHPIYILQLFIRLFLFPSGPPPPLATSHLTAANLDSPFSCPFGV